MTFQNNYICVAKVLKNFLISCHIILCHISLKMNCSILIDASERNGFVENGTVAVLVKVMDFNANTITISSEKRGVRRPFETSISAIPVQVFKDLFSSISC